MSDVAELREATFEAMEVGETLGPVQLDIDDHFIKSFAFTTDDYHPWSMVETSPFGGRVGHAGILVPELLRLLNTKFDPNTEVGLHQKEEVWFHSPVHVDERVVLSGAFTDKYVKREKGYIVTDAEARSLKDDRLIVRHRSIEIARVEPGTHLGSSSGAPPARRVIGEYPEDRDPVERVTRSTPPGAPVRGPVKWIHQDQMSVFSNVQSFWHNIHTDIRVARGAGFPSTLAQGLMETMYVSELGTKLFGPSWFTTGWTLMTFLQPVFPGDELVTKGVVLGPPADSGEDRVELEFWIENQDGVKAAVGWLSAEASD